MDWSLMIFAAGFGTRMKHLTRDQPKPMIKVAKRPLIDHALDLAKDLPATKTVVNLHYKPEKLLDHLSNKNVETIVETPDILDTGGGLLNALPLLGTNPVMTLNSDAIWKGPNPLQDLARMWDPAQMDGLLMCLPPARAIGRSAPGDFQINDAGQVIRGPGLVYGGAQIIKTNRLADIQKTVFSLNELWDLLIAENRLYAMEYSGFWCDVGHPDGILQAEQMLKESNV